jgi:hypothetical protein
MQIPAENYPLSTSQPFKASPAIHRHVFRMGATDLVRTHDDQRIRTLAEAIARLILRRTREPSPRHSLHLSILEFVASFRPRCCLR